MRTHALTVIALTMAMLLLAQLAWADQTPGYPMANREYRMAGLDAVAGRTFVLFEQHVDLLSRRHHDNISILEEGETFRSSAGGYGRMQYSACVLYAVAGDLPEEVTHDWLQQADTVTLDCMGRFPRNVRADGRRSRGLGDLNIGPRLFRGELIEYTVVWEAEGETPSMRMYCSQRIRYGDENEVISDTSYEDPEAAVDTEDSEDPGEESDGEKGIARLFQSPTVLLLLSLLGLVATLGTRAFAPKP